MVAGDHLLRDVGRLFIVCGAVDFDVWYGDLDG